MRSDFAFSCMARDHQPEARRTLSNIGRWHRGKYLGFLIPDRPTSLCEAGGSGAKTYECSRQCPVRCLACLGGRRLNLYARIAPSVVEHARSFATVALGHRRYGTADLRRKAIVAVFEGMLRM